MLKNIGIILVLITITSGLYAQTANEPDKTSLTPQQETNQKKIAEYRQKIASNPNDIETHRAYQNFMRQWGGLNDLKEEYLLKMNAEPQNPLYYYLYGRLAEDKELENAFKRALELESKTPNQELRFWVYFGFGQFYLDSKKYKEALQYLDMAAKLRPESLDVLHQTALVHYETDNITEALKIWDKILQNNKDYLDATLGKALIYKSRGMFDNAIKELENILKSDVAFWRAYEPLIQCYHAKQDYKKGEELRAQIKEIYLKRFDQGLNFGYLELIVLDIINIKPKVIIVKERITPFPHSNESRFRYADYYFEVYQEGVDKNPSYIYEIYGNTKRPTKENKETFRLTRVASGISSSQTKREIIREYTSMPSYPDLLNTVTELEKKK
ncbi:MAG: hypothetical protein HZA49_05460 [Planctomycetes bacterium]|nr:hypothetical protein [Planctomycetota bacterium]